MRDSGGAMHRAELLTFEPVFFPRVWGGRGLERYGYALPPGPIGEVWMVVDRPEVESVVRVGPRRGTSLHRLWQLEPQLFTARPFLLLPPRFPLLLKLLDCRQTLSVQVHPDATAAARLGGEPKEEFWVFMEVDPQAEVFVGLAEGVDQAEVCRCLNQGGQSLVSRLNRLQPEVGQGLSIPPGQVHAIGAGIVVAEVQDNSDTTYRVYDWGRLGLDGLPRALHVEASLQSIHPELPQPQLVPAAESALVDAPRFRVQRRRETGQMSLGNSDTFTLGIVLAGCLSTPEQTLETGSAFLVTVGDVTLEASADLEMLEITPRRLTSP